MATLIVRRPDFRLDPGICEDCEDEDKHRVKCPKCGMKICGHCWGHAHGLEASKDAELNGQCLAIDREWREAERAIRSKN